MSSDTLGVDDRVRLTLNAGDVLVSEDYEVTQGIMDQPCSFWMRLGHGDVARNLLEKYPKGSTFRIYIGGKPQFSGVTDANAANGTTGATQITVRGRDYLSFLADDHITEVKSYVDVSMADLVRAQLNEVGLMDAELFKSNEATRKIRAGVGVKAFSEPQESDAKAQLHYSVVAKLGESRLMFLKKNLDHAGLFLWSNEAGDFVISSPNTEQEPLFRFVRQRGGGARNVVNIVSVDFSDDDSRRISECVVWARHGGKKFQRTKLRGEFEDEDLRARGVKHARVFRDANVTTNAEAAFYARRKIAEAGRAGYHISYELSGHMATTTTGGRAVIIPDVMVEVDDDELGIQGLFYLEQAKYSGSSNGTRTTVRLMKKEHCVWGSDE